MATYSRADQNAVAEARQRVSDTILPMLSSADSKAQALAISMSAAMAALGLATGAFAAVHDIELAEADELDIAEEVIKMMREVRTQ